MQSRSFNTELGEESRAHQGAHNQHDPKSWMENKRETNLSSGWTWLRIRLIRLEGKLNAVSKFQHTFGRRESRAPTWRRAAQSTRPKRDHMTDNVDLCWFLRLSVLTVMVFQKSSAALKTWKEGQLLQNKLFPLVSTLRQVSCIFHRNFLL